MGEKSVFPMPLANLQTDSHQTRVCYVTRPSAHFETNQNRVEPQVRYFRKLGFFQTLIRESCAPSDDKQSPAIRILPSPLVREL